MDHKKLWTYSINIGFKLHTMFQTKLLQTLLMLLVISAVRISSRMLQMGIFESGLVQTIFTVEEGQMQFNPHLCS